MYLEVQVSYRRCDYTKPNLNGDRDFPRDNLFSPYSHDNGGHLNFSLNTRVLVNLKKSLSQQNNLQSILKTDYFWNIHIENLSLNGFSNHLCVCVCVIFHVYV